MYITYEERRVKVKKIWKGNCGRAMMKKVKKKKERGL